MLPNDAPKNNSDSAGVDEDIKLLNQPTIVRLTMTTMKPMTGMKRNWCK